MRSVSVTKTSDVSATIQPPGGEEPSLELQKPNPKPWLWQKGKSANPSTQFQPGNGGPDALRNPKPISSRVKTFLNDPYKGPNKRYRARKFTMADVLAANLIAQAAEGDMRAFELLIDRTEGKLATAQTITAGQPVQDMTPEEKRARVAELLSAAMEDPAE